MGSFTPGSGTMYAKARLGSSGTSPGELDQLTLQGTR